MNVLFKNNFLLPRSMKIKAEDGLNELTTHQQVLTCLSIWDCAIFFLLFDNEFHKRTIANFTFFIYTRFLYLK